MTHRMIIAAALVALATPASAVTLAVDFDRAFTAADGTGGRETVGGEIVADATGDKGLFEAGLGVTFSVNLANGALGAVLYESNCIASNPQGNTTGLSGCLGGDPDLAIGPGAPTGTGGLPDGSGGFLAKDRILIFQEQQGNSSLNNVVTLPTPPGGLNGTPAPVGYARPDDDVGANSVTYQFDETRYEAGINIRDLTLIDFDEGALDQVIFEFEYADGRSNAVVDASSSLITEILLTDVDGDNSIRDFFFNRVDPTLGRRVRNLTITLNNISGGIETLAFTPVRPPGTAVPLPPAALLLLAGVGAIWVKRRPTT